MARKGLDDGRPGCFTSEGSSKVRIVCTCEQIRTSGRRLTSTVFILQSSRFPFPPTDGRTQPFVGRALST